MVARCVVLRADDVAADRCQTKAIEGKVTHVCNLAVEIESMKGDFSDFQQAMLEDKKSFLEGIYPMMQVRHKTCEGIVEGACCVCALKPCSFWPLRMKL